MERPAGVIISVAVFNSFSVIGGRLICPAPPVDVGPIPAGVPRKRDHRDIGLHAILPGARKLPTRIIEAGCATQSVGNDPLKA